MTDRSEWPCLVVADGQIRLIGAALLKDGRYTLIRQTPDEPADSAANA